jgi:hypothetical protein
MADIRRPLLLTAQPLITDQRRERFWIPVQAFAADGGARPNAGALRFVSLALHILPHKGERRRRNVSARKVSEPDKVGNAFLYSSTAVSTHTAAENQQHTASLDELAEPDYYNKCAETSSTRLFASHLRMVRVEAHYEARY